MSNEFGFGVDRQASALLEISALVAGNLQRALNEHGISEDTENISDEVLASIFSTSASQNSEILTVFADRFEMEGNLEWAELCRQWGASYQAQAALLNDDSVSLESRLLALSNGAITSLDEQAERVAFGATPEKIFKWAGRFGDGYQVLQAWRNGDVSAILTTFASSYLTGMLSAIAIGTAVAAGVLSWPLVALVAIGGALVSVGLEKILDPAIDAMLEDWYGIDQNEDSDIQARISQLVAISGRTDLPTLGWYVTLGTESADLLQGFDDRSNALVGSSGDDSIRGGILDDHLSGGQGDDNLHGQAGDDTLVAGDGGDVLIGGAGNDSLRGGAGFDEYRFISSEFTAGSEDVILDSDGLGKITFEGIAVGDYSVNNVSRDGLGWETHDRVFRLQVIGSGDTASLMIVHRETGGRIIINNWSNGDLGITLPDLGQPGTPENPFLLTNGADLIGHDGDHDAGTPVSGDDVISGLAGNDGIDGGYGDDWIDGGHGDDLLLGGSGSNRLIGGLGNDIIINYANVMGWEPWSDPSYGDQFDAINSTVSHGNGWLASSSAGAADANNAPQQLLSLQLRAWGPADGNPETDEIWVGLDPNVFKNGDDEIDAGDGSDTVYGGEGDDRIAGGTGNDLLIGGSDIDFINGEDGDDLILGDDLTYGTGLFSYLSTQVSTTANVSGNDVLVGGLGNDRISGQGGTDVIDGGEGNDILSGDRIDFVLGMAIDQPVVSGNDHIDGGAGNDWISGDGGNDTLSGGTGADIIFGDSTTLDAGEHGKDVIKGDAGNDELYGGGGDDELDGGADDDIVFGEDGNDRLQGGAGIDELIGGLGNDSLSGGDGNDKLWGDAGTDRLDGGAGADELQGGDGTDTLIGGEGDDKLWGDAGNDSASGGNGQDQIAGGEGDDTLDGGAGNDILNGNAGQDTLWGGAGNDNLSGNGDNDTVEGGDGDDYVGGDDGNDVLRGGAGNDSLFGGLGSDQIYGGEGNDHAEGGAEADIIAGEAGNDVLLGNDGDDTLTGGAGNDLLDGGAGSNTYVFSRGFGTDHLLNLDLNTSGAQTIIFGSDIAMSDLTYAAQGQDLIIGLVGSADVLVAHGFFGIDSVANIELSDGSTLSRAELALILGLSNPVSGTSGDDTFNGTEDNDSIYGEAGDDTLYGAIGDDYLNGGSGNDFLSGGIGNDVLEGGTGNDAYEFHPGFGIDTVLGLGLASSGTDTFLLGAGITSDNVQVDINGDDLSLTFFYGGTPGSDFDVLDLEGFFAAANSSHIIQFINGSTWTAATFANNTIPAWNGSAGNDIRTGTSANETFNGLAGDDLLSGVGGNDLLDGGTGNDVLHGGEGNDRLVGGSDIDAGYGGSGDDSYYGVENIFENQNEGIDTQYVGQPQDGTDGSGTIAANVENIQSTTFSYSSFRTIVGNSLNNRMVLQNGSNTLVYAASMDGGIGADYYEFDSGSTQRYATIYIDDANDTWKAYGQAQFDVRSVLNSIFVFDASIREFHAIGASTATVMGDSRDNLIYLHESAAVNQASGGNGNDTYVISANDVVMELQNAGYDKVDIKDGAGTIYHAADNIEHIVVSGSTIAEAYGNDLNNLVEGRRSIYGSGGDDILIGDGYSGSTQIIDGGTGADDMRGNAYSQIYYVDNVLDKITDNYAGYDWGSNDSVVSSIDYTLGATIENLQLVGNAIYANGNDRWNQIIGNSQNNVINSGGGSDRLFGMGGADTYIFNKGDGLKDVYETENIANESDLLRFGLGINPGDISIRKVHGHEALQVVVSETVNGITSTIGYVYIQSVFDGVSGVERIQFADGTTWNVDDHVELNAPPAIGSTLQAQEMIESLYYSMVLPEDLFVNEPEEVLDISFDFAKPSWLNYDPATRLLYGIPPDGAGSGSFAVIATDSWGQTVSTNISYAVLNMVAGNASNNTLNGTSGRDALFGFEGNDVLNGGLGADRLVGSIGNDTYTIDNLGDVVIELDGEGSDLVNSSISYTAGLYIENVTLSGAATSSAVGNGLANILIGNSASNTLIALDGDDTLDGKGGADTMQGGQGNDIYIVDTTADVIVESAAEGLDLVNSSVTYSLASNVENVTLTGNTAINATGNASANNLIGNSAINTLNGLGGDDALDGKGGADIMRGGQGNDTYTVDNTGDAVIELAGEGVDTVISSVTYALASEIENLVLSGTSAVNGTGNAGANSLVGNSGNNTLTALGGNDMLEGKGGVDTLTGGVGSDAYLMGRTYGADTVVENDSTVGNTDVARFITGVVYDQLWFKRPTSSNNLEISIIGTTDKLVIKDWFLGGQYRVEEIRTVDGNRVLLAANVQALVNAMAGMTMPAQGQTTLTPSQHTTLDPVFNANWQTAPQGVTGGSLPAMSTGGTMRTMPTKPAIAGPGQASLHDAVMSDLEGHLPNFDSLWRPLERHGQPIGELFDWEFLVPHAPPTSLPLTKPMRVDNLAGSDAVLSDCHQLISMMAIGGRAELTGFNPNPTERLYQLIP